MRLKKTRSCDVLVVGSGIAGISAALKAAESGCSVILACKGQLFSGSSFYPGTWGLGLIGPADQRDEEDLVESIRQIGCNMTDPEMVRTFVTGIHPAIDRVRRMGVKLRRADNSAQKEFIPCFDHKHRDWNGIEFDSAREVFGQQLAQRKVELLPKCEVLQLIKDADRVCGAVLAQEN
jgi:L-aspartate oxidase